MLRDRGNDVLVVLGPFNEHMMTDDNRAAYRSIRDGIAAWLRQNHVSAVIPEVLPSVLYADASHPLTEGYESARQTHLRRRDVPELVRTKEELALPGNWRLGAHSKPRDKR